MGKCNLNLNNIVSESVSHEFNRNRVRRFNNKKNTRYIGTRLLTDAN